MSRIIGWTLAAAAAFGASAIAAAPAQAQYYGQRPGYGYGYDRGFERHAVDICRHQAQRRYARRGGARVDVRDVRSLRNGRIRVLGAVELRGNRWDGRGDRRDDRRLNRGRIAFSCDVDRRGRLSRFRTHNYRW
jgi:hypothetical protein